MAKKFLLKKHEYRHSIVMNDKSKNICFLFMINSSDKTEEWSEEKKKKRY